ncbi:MAG TPA: hypothetical protein VHF47_12415 [Acidimicrobiales bacterium]|nr:hypothetical protein [Acidimicrobiales bacterium]
MARAEDRASIANLGAAYRMHVWLSGPWREVRELKGPVFADHMTSRREDADALWNGTRPLALTIASDVDPSSDLIRRLCALAKTGDVKVFVGPAYTDVVPEDVVRLKFEGIDEDADHSGSIRIGSAIHALWLQQGWRELARRWFGDDQEDRSVTSTRYLELQAHDSLQNDVFVTTNPRLLRDRFGSAWFHRSGIATPREVLTAVEVFLRGRHTITPVLEPKYRLSLGKGMFYGYVTEARLPHVVQALRSCLSPARNAEYRHLADHVLNILARHRSLLVASDALYRAGLAEGHMYANNLIISEQLYHLQFALVLVAGILDEIAWVVAILDRSTPRRNEISWRALRKWKNWLTALTSTDAQRMAAAARSHSSAALMDLGYDMRDAIQHRQPLQAEVVEVQSEPMAVGRLDGPAEARIAMLDLNACVKPVHLRLPVDTRGAIVFDTRPYLIPHQFFRGVVDAVDALVDDTFACVPWVDADGWWEPEEAELIEHRELVRLSDWLFGPSEQT